MTLFSDKLFNDPPRLYEDKQKVFDEIFSSVEKQGRYSVPVLLKSKSFCRVFGFLAPMASGNQGEERPEGGAPSSSGDASEPRPSRGEHIQRDSRSQDESIEYVKTLGKELERILPYVPI